MAVLQQLEILDARSHKLLYTLENISPGDKVAAIKRDIYRISSKLYPDRQALRLEPKGKTVSDDKLIGDLNLPSKGGQLYLRDLGPQIGWQTVFLVEYAGPFFLYPIFYLRPTIVYGAAAALPMHSVVKLALLCFSLHYAKRLLETLFVHRFSHATMPLMNIFKNSFYYWIFALFVSYFVNHPLYTPPQFGSVQIMLGLGLFALAEVGNLSIHLLLRDLRPAGTRQRNIPVPNSNPLTGLFSFVSCPNYTYEVLAWFAFALMTQTLPALLFCFVGFAQMAIWAKGKHRNYKKEFPNYPKRKAIIPFLM